MSTIPFDELCEKCGIDPGFSDWCRVCRATALALGAEWALRWGVYATLLVWSLVLEWKDWHQSRSLIRLIQSRVPVEASVHSDTLTRLEVLFLSLVMIVTGESTLSGIDTWIASVPSSTYWAFAVAVCVWWIAICLLLHPFRSVVMFQTSNGSLVSVFGNGKGPFTVRSQGAEKILESVDDLVEHLKGAKAN